MGASAASARRRAPSSASSRRSPSTPPDGKPVAQVFVLLVPEQATEKHLQLLAELAQMFSEARFRDGLAGPTDAAGLRAVFEQWTPAP